MKRITYGKWVTIYDLKNGTMFETRDGKIYVKLQSPRGCIHCAQVRHQAFDFGVGVIVDANDSIEGIGQIRELIIDDVEDEEAEHQKDGITV